MTANLLTLNSSKTEFLLIGLTQQLAKINTSFLITTHSARNLMNTSLSLTKYLLSLDHAIVLSFSELRCIRPYLDFKTGSTIATSIVHSKLDYCNSLYYNLSQSQKKDCRTSLLLVLSPERQNLFTSLLLNLYISSK